MRIFRSFVDLASRKKLILGAFLMNLRFSSVMVLAPLFRHALINREITPALGSFQTPTGISPPPPKGPNKRSLGQVLLIAGELNTWLCVLYSSFGGV
jgi:flagellar biosynthesis protein FliR